jgi:MOSC domain-containing protein YiiM
MAPIMPSASGSLVSVQIGPVAPLGPKGVPSGFIKRPTDEPVSAGQFGLTGDQQADRRVHGGPDKALYCYPTEHYIRWGKLAPRHKALLVPGGFGENLTTEGLGEDRVAIGDIFRIGFATVQVTQPRQTCFKLAIHFDDPRMVRAMIRLGFSGWYLRVLDPGLIKAGTPITLVDRRNLASSIARFNRLINNGAATVEELAELADLPGLAQSWQETARASLGARIRAHAGQPSSSKTLASTPPQDGPLRHSSRP